MTGRIRRLEIVRYRLNQTRQQLGIVAPLTQIDYLEVQHWLPTRAQELFRTMSQADQQHSLRVCRGLQARGCQEADMLAAALLHDIGKAQGRVPFWTRPTLVLGKKLLPGLLKRLIIAPQMLQQAELPRWQRGLNYAWWHAEIGAELAASAGLSDQAVLYIRTHHQPHGPAAELHMVDEVS